MTDINFNGAAPLGSLTLSGNTLYGMLISGQPFGTSNGNIFSIDTNGNNLKDLYDFDTGAMGYYPQGSLTQSGNVFYGMTFYGGKYKNGNQGSSGDGVIFSFIDTTGIITSTDKLNKTPQAITLFPNPNNGKFIIQSSVKGSPLSVEVFNMLGEKIYYSSINSGSMQIDLSNTSAGIYLYRVLTETGYIVSTGKFVIQK